MLSFHNKSYVSIVALVRRRFDQGSQEWEKCRILLDVGMMMGFGVTLGIYNVYYTRSST